MRSIGQYLFLLTGDLWPVPRTRYVLRRLQVRGTGHGVVRYAAIILASAAHLVRTLFQCRARGMRYPIIGARL